MSRRPRPSRATALGALALLAACALSACQDGGGDEARDTGPVATPAPVGPSTPAAAVGDRTAGNGKGSAQSGDPQSGQVPAARTTHTTGPAARGPATGDQGDGPVPHPCTSANTKLTVKAVPRPLNHMLLTMTNTGSRPCNACLHPYLQFGQAQAVSRVVEDSKPQTVVTIEPGRSAYAGVLTSSADGSGTDGYSTKDLHVSFQGRDGESGATGPAVHVPLGKSVYVDNTLAVTHWQSTSADALDW
ncbi:DUF4232 domain-containing protein [Streptomyces roseolilacinus]|uniref:DUF4232 domain-containing protein n=1 Tax=Streptomyces roseolilacinus TaxID=66904 RepID=A0A918AWT2_9ACTN|nr:DUF4232 domain-containing protein [Streptomyces roseolilacinus]GGP95657.1 hypothetical protein GCM10010249_12160 [Streptomyces roseolilacinus]